MKRIVIGILVMGYTGVWAEIFHVPPTVHFWDGLEFNPQKRKSSAPYLSGDTFKSFCDHVFDETKTDLDTDAVKSGDAIFLVADVLPYFFQTVYPHIKNPIIIVTHNGDSAFPGDFASYLDDEKIIAWFTVNQDRTHSKLHAIPIGLANSYWPHGNIETVRKASEEHLEKNIFLCASYLSPTHESRRHIYDYFRGKPYCSFVAQKPHNLYLQDLRRSTFVLSPRGNGIDCHRTWEALYMGAIPIVPSTSINSVYDDLPVIIVDDWSTLTEAFLNEILQEYKTRTFTYEKLYADYWFNLISAYKNVPKSAHEKVFTHIYEKAIWGRNEEGLGHSGGGSMLQNCEEYIAYVEDFIEDHSIKSVVDAGCGDWEFSRHMNWEGIQYFGCDVVEDVIRRNILHYSAPNIQFVHGNLITMDLPKADLLLCKHVLQHLRNVDIKQFVTQLQKYKYCLITNEVYPHNLTSDNPDIEIGGGHKIDLSKPPFNVNGKAVLNYFVGKSVHQVFLIDNTLSES